MGGGRCVNAVGTVFIVGFYLVTTLVYFREQIQRSSYFALQQPPQPRRPQKGTTWDSGLTPD